MEDVLHRFHGNLSNIMDENGNTALMMAAMVGDEKMVKLILMKSNIDPNY